MTPRKSNILATLAATIVVIIFWRLGWYSYRATEEKELYRNLYEYERGSATHSHDPRTVEPKAVDISGSWKTIDKRTLHIVDENGLLSGTVDTRDMSDMAEEKGVDLSIISSSIHGYRNGTNGELHCRVITHHKQVRSVQTDVEDIVISAIYPDRMLGQRTRKLEAKVFLVGSTVETNLIIDSTDTFFAVRQ